MLYQTETLSSTSAQNERGVLIWLENNQSLSRNYSNSEFAEELNRNLEVGHFMTKQKHQFS